MSSSVTTARGRRSSARSSSSTRFFVTWKSQVVKRDRSEKLEQALVDAQEHLLRQVLGEAAVADEPQHVVVDRLLVRPDDERERSLVTTLSLAEHPGIGLRQGQCAASIQRVEVISRTIYESVACQRLLTSERSTGHRCRHLDSEQIEHGRSEVGELAAVAERSPARG